MCVKWKDYHNKENVYDWIYGLWNAISVTSSRANTKKIYLNTVRVVCTWDDGYIMEMLLFVKHILFHCVLAIHVHMYQKHTRFWSKDIHFFVPVHLMNYSSHKLAFVFLMFCSRNFIWPIPAVNIIFLESKMFVDFFVLCI